MVVLSRYIWNHFVIFSRWKKRSTSPNLIAEIFHIDPTRATNESFVTRPHNVYFTFQSYTDAEIIFIT
jgi:hypothetical protein